MRRAAFSIRVCAAIAAIAAMSSGAFAAERATKDEAVAMVRKAVDAIKSEGADKAYAEISDPSGPFVDRELYITVTGPDGTMLANGANKSLIGVNRINTKDADGKPFIKERMELAKDNPSFWQSYNTRTPSPRRSSRSRCIASGSTRRRFAGASISRSPGSLFKGALFLSRELARQIMVSNTLLSAGAA
jgi:hypothetical protein